MSAISTEKIFLNADSAGIKKFIVPAADENSFDKIIKLCQKFSNVYGALGVHPCELKDFSKGTIDKIRTLKSEKIVAVGEIGLDYYWDKSNVAKQKEAFTAQIKLANELNLPIIVHDREAHKDTFDILNEFNSSSDVIMHCFSGSTEFMRECVKKGYYIGIGGVVTFKNATKMKEVATSVPLENLLLETDSPYLTPEPHRGEENQPAYVRLVAEEIAKLRQCSFEEIADATSTNAERVFGI